MSVLIDVIQDFLGKIALGSYCTFIILSISNGTDVLLEI